MLIDLAFIGTAAVSMRSALKYRRNWDKNGPTVQLLRKFMPRGSKGFRVYTPIGHAHAISAINIPLPVRLAVRKAGFRITDYLAKKCVKLNDKDQRNVFNIGKVISKDAVAKAAFDNDPQLQNSSTAEFTLVVSCHPYDIIGMSTGRDWDETSCMRMKDYRDKTNDGSNIRYLEHDVAEGTLVAYAIRSEDTNIEKPLGRCLLKPFLRDDDSGTIFYRRETDVYGNPVPGMSETLARFLRKLNAGVPAGIYKRNEKLYDDGVGDQAENEGSSDDNSIDWSMVDDQQKLRERPELFVDFASYLVKRNKEGVTDANVVINILIDHAKTIDARFVKPVARLIAQPKFAAAFFEHAAATFADSDSEAIAKFMQSRDLRHAVKRAEKESGEAPDSYLSLSFLSPAHAHRYFLREVKHNEDNLNFAALSAACGTAHLNAKDIESIPQLHKYVWKYAELIREGSVYGSKTFQESAHRILSTVKPYVGPYESSDIEDIGETLAEDKDLYKALVAWYINSITNNKDNSTTTNILTNIIGYRRFYRMLKDRRVRKRLLGLKNIPEDARAIIVRAIGGIFGDHDDRDAQSIQRELITHIKRNPMDCLSFETYMEILSNADLLYPYIWFSNENEINTETVERFLHRATTLRNAAAEFPFAVPLNEWQERIFRVAKTFALVIGEPTAEDQENMQVDPAVMDILVKQGGLMRALGHYRVNLADYPQLLNAATYSSAGVYPYDLIADDDGAAFIQSLNGKDLDATASLLGAMAADFGSFGVPVSAAAGMNRVLTDIAAPKKIGDLVQATPEYAVKRFNLFIDAIRKTDRFIAKFPENGTLADWQKVLPQMDEQHVAQFNELSERMRKESKSVKPVAQMFIMFAHGEAKDALKAVIPPDWLTIEDL
jgi:hypothetical protein